MKVEQFVMTYEVEQDKLRALLPAFATEPKKQYQKQNFCVENAAAIPCKQVLGCYVITFER